MHRMEGRVVLALDSGTQSSRAFLFDARGSVVAADCQEHQPMQYPEPGAVEQCPLDIRNCLYEAIRRCLSLWGGDPKNVAGATLTTQRSAFLLLDHTGEPLTNVASWLDRRTANIKSEPSTVLRLSLTAMGENGLLPRLLAKSWPRIWRDKHPELLAKAGHVATIESWLHSQLIGRVAMAPSAVAGPWPFDVKRRTWSRSGLMFKALGFRRAWLPDIVEAGHLIGRLTPKAAADTGLPQDLPFYACGGDKQAEALGAGVRATSNGIAAVSLGTGSSISIPWPKPVTSLTYDWITMASAEPDSFWHEYLLFRGMWTARWFSENLARDLKIPAKSSGQAIEAILCEEASEIPAGADGLVIWPRWSPTIRHPFETGAVVGLRETHTRAHLFRALLEGIAFDLKRGLQILEKALVTQVTEVRVGGGGARSDVVVQILADVLGLPVVRPVSEELAARGAAITAAVATGLHSSVDAAVNAMVPSAATIRPQPKQAQFYERLFRTAYLPGLKKVGRLSRLLAR